MGFTNFIKWLYTKIDRYGENTYKDLLDELYCPLVSWINNENLDLIIDIDELHIYFYLFMYNNTFINYSINNNMDCINYFNMRYHEDIIDLYIQLKDISDIYCSNLFKYNTADDLLYFLSKYIFIEYIIPIIQEEEDDIILNDDQY